MKQLLIGAILVTTAGCVSNQHDLSPNFGASTKGNLAAQIVDPTPAAGAPEGDGAAVDTATALYKTDKVKPPTSGKFKPGSTTGGSSPQ